MTKILHLTLKKKWFDLIKSGEKKEEYREVKEFWKKRFFERNLIYSGNSLMVKRFDVIYFRNGYKKDSPFMKVEWKGLGLEEFEGKECFAIQLGKVLEVLNA